MKTKKIKVRQGFTIVELVIVIGVIGVLTAVLVPTFINLNKKAEEASNQAFVKNLNTQMAIREQEEGKNATMFDAVVDAKDIGFDVEKLTPVNGRDLVWDSVANRFLLLEQNGDVFYGKDEKKATKDTDLWKIASVLDATPKYSIYAKYGWGDDVSNLKVGFDAGYNTKIGTVSYVGGASAQDVTIRTNSAFTKLNVNAPSDTVRHYGNAADVNVTAIAKNSYHEYGSVGNIRVKAGKVEVERDGFVGSVGIDKDATSSTVEVANKGAVFGTKVVDFATGAEAEGAAAKAIADGISTKSSTDVLTIGTADSLINLAAAQTNGLVNRTLKIELSNDIDLSGKAWVPFGSSYDHTFAGVIDGKNHKITGLTNKNTDPSLLASFIPTSSGVGGEVFGLIGAACFENGDSLEIKNLVMDKVDIAGDNLKGAGALIGLFADGEHVSDATGSFSSVTVRGSLEGKDKIAGFIGAASHNNYIQGHSISFNNCTNEANVTALSGSARAAGFVGQFGDGNADAKHTVASILSFEKCTNKGNIASKVASGQTWAGAFLAHKNIPVNATKMTVTVAADCTNTGTVTVVSSAGVITQ